MKARTPADLIRDIDSRNCAIRVYAEAYERACEREMVFRLVGRDDEADKAVVMAAIALRALEAEGRAS